MKQYQIVAVYMGGEKMSLLCDAASGIPLFEPTAFSLHLRNNGLAESTIDKALRIILLFYQVLASLRINLVERIKAGDLLTMGEIETIVEQCKLDQAVLNEIHFGPIPGAPTNLNVSRYKRGSKQAVALKQVENNTAIGRLTYVISFMVWLTNHAYFEKWPVNREKFKELATRTIAVLYTKVPAKRKTPAANIKRGITKSKQQELKEVAATTSSKCPWKNAFVIERNQLIIELLLALGMRKGELLGIKIKDIFLRDGMLFIARRPDDIEDPRRRKPATKTNDRMLPIGHELVERIVRYLATRSKIAGAKKHPFLIISTSGKPMAINTIDVVFSDLRTSLNTNDPLHAHLLRHSWNDNFSEATKGMPPEEVRKIRNYLMGWAEGSKMDQTYGRRFIEEKAHEAMEKMQKQMTKNYKK